MGQLTGTKGQLESLLTQSTVGNRCELSKGNGTLF